MIASGSTFLTLAVDYHAGRASRGAGTGGEVLGGDLNPFDEELLVRLDSLWGAHAVSGYEETLASEVARECSSYADEVRTDSLGNVIARVRAEGLCFRGELLRVAACLPAVP